MSDARCVKMIGNVKFILELVESTSGSYYIVEDRDGEKTFSSPIKDLNVALSIFNTKLMQLEGN